jgi:hypothetical protein
MRIPYPKTLPFSHPLFLNHLTAPDAHFFCRCRRATPVKLDLSGFPDLMAHFQFTATRSCREVKV